MGRDAKKAIKDLRDLAEDQGWQVKFTGGGHIRWMPPNSTVMVHTTSTPSDYRALENLKRDLRKAGLHIPKK